MRNVLFFCTYVLINGTQVFIIIFWLVITNSGKRRLAAVEKYNDIRMGSESDRDRIMHLFKPGSI